jgi:hypothetical protein
LVPGSFRRSSLLEAPPLPPLDLNILLFRFNLFILSGADNLLEAPSEIGVVGLLEKGVRTGDELREPGEEMGGGGSKAAGAVSTDIRGRPRVDTSWGGGGGGWLGGGMRCWAEETRPRVRSSVREPEAEEVTEAVSGSGAEDIEKSEEIRDFLLPGSMAAEG